MKAKIIAVVNQKGGVGKSTTAQALTAGLLLKNFACLTIDLDAQGNLTYTLGAKTNEATILEVLTGEVEAKDATQHLKNGDTIAANKALAGADAFISETGKEYRLKEALQSLEEQYDYIIIDTPPTLGILTVNALTACNSIIIPAQLANTMRSVRKYCNPNLQIEGILLTRYNSRSVLSKEVAELANQLAKKLGTRLFKSTIREGVAVKEAQISQKSIFEYAPQAKVAQDYKAFIEELLSNKRKEQKND